MPQRHEIRRLAMQILFEVDMRGEADIQLIESNLLSCADCPDSPETRRQALALARDAWNAKIAGDALVNELAPQWPTHRQPPVDRAILRLAYHEITSGYSPPGVAINEAIELAKSYSTEQSPSFVNGVLDQVAQRTQPGAVRRSPAPGSAPAPGATPAPGSTTPPAAPVVPPGDQWLADAVNTPPAKST